MTIPQDKFEKILYICKILSCAVMITGLSIIFDRDKSSSFFLWAVLTALVSLQFEAQKRVNFNQIFGNLIGSSIGIMIWLLIANLEVHRGYIINTQYWYLLLGIFLTTLVCILLKHSEYCGIALSSFLIVTLYDVSHHSFDGAITRIIFCTVGCLVAYFIDAISTYFAKRYTSFSL